MKYVLESNMPQQSLIFFSGRFEWILLILSLPPNFGYPLVNFQCYSLSLKSDSHLPKIFFICINDSPYKMMKNAFYFILKALFVLKMFKFVS